MRHEQDRFLEPSSGLVSVSAKAQVALGRARWALSCHEGQARASQDQAKRGRDGSGFHARPLVD